MKRVILFKNGTDTDGKVIHVIHIFASINPTLSIKVENLSFALTKRGLLNVSLSNYYWVTSLC